MAAQPDRKHILLIKTNTFAWSVNAYLLFAPLLIGAAIMMSLYIFPHAVNVPCPFKVVTGIPCATCGSTRSLLSLLHFNLEDSFLFNPLMFILGFLLVTGGILSMFFSLQKEYYQVRFSSFFQNVIRVAVIISFILNWVYVWLIFPEI